jgi:hypothetical protein
MMSQLHGFLLLQVLSCKNLQGVFIEKYTYRGGGDETKMGANVISEHHVNVIKKSEAS